MVQSMDMLKLPSRDGGRERGVEGIYSSGEIRKERWFSGEAAGAAAEGAGLGAVGGLGMAFACHELGAYK